MRIIRRSVVVTAMVVIAACSDDSNDNNNAQQLAEQAEQAEQTPLEANTVSDNVVIAGATKEEGTPPTPNEAISLDVSSTGETAFLNEGFNIALSSDANIVGAYLQFKSDDGTMAGSYYDIPLSSNDFGKGQIKTLKGKRRMLGNTAKDADVTLDVDFNAQIEPGTFCYEICVYDAEGNISAPSEVCVTVESWGGSSEVVGRWKAVKQEYTEDGETDAYVIGEEDCDEWTPSCTGGSEFTAVECTTEEFFELEIKADGSFIVEFKGEYELLDYDASFDQCEAIYGDPVKFRYYGEGNWAYVASEKRLTLVEYSYTEEENGESQTETVEPGSAELIYDGKAEVNGSSFVLTETYDDDGDGTNEGVYTYYFEK